MSEKKNKALNGDVIPTNYKYIDLDTVYEHRVMDDQFISINYKIRNYSDDAIYVGSSLLGRFIIPPQDRSNSGTFYRMVYLDVNVEVADHNRITDIQSINANTPLDKAICGIMIKMMTEKKRDLIRSDIGISPWRYNLKLGFSIALTDIDSSNSEGNYHSELLGLYISTKANSRRIFLDTLPDTLKPEGVTGATTAAQYEISYFVDNENTAGSIWTMANGEPVCLNKVKHTGLASGLYIYTNRLYHDKVYHKFIPANQLHDDDILSAEGYATTKKELLSYNHTKEFITLKGEKSKLSEENADLKDKNKKLEKENTEFKDKAKSLKKGQNDETSAMKRQHQHELNMLRSEVDALKRNHQNEINLAKHEALNTAHEISALKRNHQHEINMLKHDAQRKQDALKDDITVLKFEKLEEKKEREEKLRILREENRKLKSELADMQSKETRAEKENIAKIKHYSSILTLAITACKFIYDTFINKKLSRA